MLPYSAKGGFDEKLHKRDGEGNGELVYSILGKTRAYHIHQRPPKYSI